MTDGKDALMVDCGDVDALANAIARVRDEPGLRTALIDGGQETLRNRFSEEAITQAYIRLFETGTSAP